MIRELKFYGRMAVGLAKWSRYPRIPDYDSYVRDALANRETNFLQLMRQGVFENPTNPYRQLFSWAGCTYEDLQSAVSKDGLEATLCRLYREGVYLTHDEFKGRVPARRGTREILVDSTDLANPSVSGAIEVASSGSRSRGTVTRRSLEYQNHREAQDRMLWLHYGLGERSVVIMSSILPGSGGFRRLINMQRWGTPPPDAWFDLDGDGGFAYRAMTEMFLLELRMLGIPVVCPQILENGNFLPAAEFIAAQKKKGKSVLLLGGASKAVRVADAARQAGLDISGSLVVTNGEALTDAKRAVIEAAGCEAHARYTISELGPVGAGCRHMEGNCVHVFRDSLAVISRRRTPPLSDVEVESLMFTTLLPCAATITINVEMDDAGELGPARCDCPLARMGLTQQIDRIFSYGKLTGHGTSLLAGDILTILEKSLPERFGGISLDYQLVEREGANQTEFDLRVHPRVAPPGEEEVRSFFLAEVRRLWSGSLTARRWENTNGIRVVIGEPFRTGARQKIHPLHLLHSGDRMGRDRN